MDILEHIAPEGYKAVKATAPLSCEGCAFEGCKSCMGKFRPCFPTNRPDGASVIFVKREDTK